MQANPMRRLASAALVQAMQDSAWGSRQATAWLASTQAEVWFDYLDLPQSRVLARCGWLKWAEPHLTNQCVLVTHEYLTGLAQHG